MHLRRLIKREKAAYVFKKLKKEEVKKYEEEGSIFGIDVSVGFD